MRHTITIVGMLLCFAVGSLSAGQQTLPIRQPVASSVSASPQTPCLHQYANGLQLCTDNKIVQEVWTFPANSWDGSPLPIGSAIGLQMNRIPTGPNTFFTLMQFIYSAPGGARFGPTMSIDNNYFVQLRNGLNAQGP